MRIEDDILDIARRVPSRPAIEAEERVITFGELDQLTRTWAEKLRRAGLDAGHPVWVFMPNCVEFVLAVLTVWRAGGVVVPVNSRLTDDELRQLSLSCPPAGVWCLDRARARVHDIFGDRNPAAIIAVNADGLIIEQLESGCVLPSLALHVREGKPGVVYFTSGSTGRPKAILLTHTNIASNARATAAAFGLRFEDRSVVCMQMCHSYTLTKQILAHLGVGATLILAPDFFQPAVVWDLVDRFRATTICAVPSMLVMMYEQVRRQSLCMPTLRLLTTGGSPMPEHVQLGLCRTLPHVSFISSYGLSEASPCVTALPPEWAVDKVGSIGRAIPGVEVRIANESGGCVALGDAGELCVCGPNVMAGYLLDPAATDRALRDGWLHTGDVGWMDPDGCVYLHGRKDDLILRGGENVYPAEVENVISGHPAVLEAAVVGVPHSVLGQDIAAYVTLRERSGADFRELREHCLRRIASFKVPREIHIVDVLPRTPNGKLCRKALRDSDANYGSSDIAMSAKELS